MRSLQAVARELVEEPLARQAEALRGLRLVSAGGGERGGELAALEGGELGVEGIAGGVLVEPRAAQGGGQILDEDLVAAAGDDERALHLVAQLAQVAGPGVDLEGAQRVAGQPDVAGPRAPRAGLGEEVVREEGEGAG